MDWTKAKNMLIVALIVTNLILIYAYVYKNDAIMITDENILEDTIELLESKNIYIETEIPRKYNSMAVLSVEYDKMSQDLIDQQLASQTVMRKKSDEAIINMTTNFIKKCNLFTETMVFESLEKRNGKTMVTYKNYYNDIPVEDSYVICTVENGKVRDIQRFWLNPIETNKARKKKLIPAAAALIKFMSENEDEKEIHVEDITLVYWLDSSSFDAESPIADTAFPAWRITYNKGKTEYIIAFEQ